MSRDPRPQAVIGTSQTRSGFQDLLALSIENQNDSINTSPRLDRGAVAGDPGHHQASYPRVVERSRHLPGPREVIVIDDETPYPKRRRVIEDDYGRFRPYPSRELYRSVTPTFHSRDAAVRPIALPRHTEGLSSNLPLVSSRPVLSERLHINEVPDFRSNEMRSDLSTRDNERVIRQQPVPYSRREMTIPRPYLIDSDENYIPQRVAGNDMRLVERDQFVRREQVERSQRYYFQRPASPDQPVTRRISHSQYVDTPSGQAFIQRFSQSGLEPSFSRPQDDPISYQRYIPDVRRNGDRPDQAARSYTVMRPFRARSPVLYLDTPE